jgi:hypothetical protein
LDTVLARPILTFILFVLFRPADLQLLYDTYNSNNNNHTNHTISLTPLSELLASQLFDTIHCKSLVPTVFGLYYTLRHILSLFTSHTDDHHVKQAMMCKVERCLLSVRDCLSDMIILRSEFANHNDVCSTLESLVTHPHTLSSVSATNLTIEIVIILYTHALSANNKTHLRNGILYALQNRTVSV